MNYPRDLRRLPPTHFSLIVALLTVLFTLGKPLSFGQQPQKPRQFPPGSLNRPSDLPPGKFRERLEQLPDAPRGRALGWLKSFHFTEHDLQSLQIDSEGGLFYTDPPAAIEPQPAPAATEPITSQAAVPSSPFPESLLFHSRPGAPNVIFLNFSGDTITGTQWNTDLGRTEIFAQAFNTDSDFSTFSDSEQSAIKQIWQRIAEDYAPFNVDVTTERPSSFTSRTAHALITRKSQTDGALNPSSNSGGVAYVNVFGSSSFSRYRPAWIYYDNLGFNAAYISEAASHEIGHNMGLSHDGRTDGQDYYGGHGSGETSWAPIMGTGYNRSVSQWSKGDYYLANNTQDDLATIAGKLSYLTDDHGNTPSSATALALTSGTNIVSTTPESDPAKTNTANKGVIERNTDIDVYSFVTGSGPVQISVNPWVTPSGTRGNNLDVRLDLYNETGSLLLTIDPATATGATLQTNLLQGIYYLWIRNAAAGAPLSSSPSGYTTYGSIGQYFINGFLTPSSGFIVAPAAELAPTSIETVGLANADFTVTYSDNVAIDVATIGNTDLQVTGPNNFNRAAQFLSLDVNNNGTPRRATYSLPAPNGVSWLPSDNGAYQIFIRTNEVSDVEGAFIPPRELGQITVAIPVQLYAANMTTDPGWTFDSQWAYGAPNKGASGPSAGFTGPNVIAYNLTGNYGNNINPPRYATTPAINCSGSSALTLKFRRWLRLRNGDTATIQVSTNNTDWLTLWSSSSRLTDTTWQELRYTLPASIAGKPAVRLRWGLASNQSQFDTGWAIDDVQLLGDGTFDAEPPTATLNVANLTQPGAPSHPLTVTYNDKTSVRLASLDSQDILVTGPNSYSNIVEFIGADLPTDGVAITASYSIPAPTGAWTNTDNGEYQVTLIEDQIEDILNNSEPGAILGNFTVAIPDPVPPQLLLNLALDTTTGEATLNWPAAGTHLYTIESADNIQGPFTPVQDATDLPSTTQTFTLPFDPAPQRYFRLTARTP